MFDEATVRAVERIAARTKTEPAAWLAVAEVESAGRVFAVVGGKHEPLIRFEGHYFDRRLTGEKRDRARREGLAHPNAGAVKNPAGQAARWRLLARAMEIDAEAALESTSWGLGQVMGAHWQWLGFKTVKGLVGLARKDAAGQIELMARYVEKAGLVDELQRKDFSAFARGYNGPGFAKHGYHTKMARAYERLSGAKPVSAATGMLRMGSKGARVLELQVLLRRAGHAVEVDGDYGPATKDAVMAFQRAGGLAVDGVAGPETMRALQAFRKAPDERPGEPRVTEVPEVRDAAKGLGPVAIVMSIRDQIAELGYSLFGIEIETAQTVANGLLAVSGLIGAGLAVYGLYGWWRSRQTEEGDVRV
ncbi:N-acetylmuramidase domain-containing protein [Chelativorans salis]|uniref:N-acetylmuramidase domain-containing protein n=1 Tax=Chelativorans salis TaxID=2978478 RepID=A0ABT2LM58_9HYPH|nr:N-acetylmuramidase domain-containing protein [Chelativorans sp. EGI FJ00035]MCT7375474.1 N-acetylmuramidase domain-containing protein [Chelativorans sp. EGI FJ00035]